MRGREADDTHERRAGNTHARQVWRRGEAIRDSPADDVRLGKKIAQKTEAGYLDGEAEGLGLDLHEGDFEQVPRFGALDEDRAGQGMDHIQVDPSQISGGRVRPDLTI